MKIFAFRLSWYHKIALLFATIVSATTVYFLTYQYVPTAFDPTSLREWIGSFGLFAPVVFVFVQIVQVIVAPIPGQFVALLGGYLFGPINGTIYSMIGVTVGSGIVFLITKRYGRPFVERVLHEEVIAKLDTFTNRAGLPGLFVFFVIPGTPDDAVCFLAGLTPIRSVTFLTIVVIGRLPAYVLTNVAGESLATGRIVETIVILGTIGVISGIAYLFRRDIERRLGRG